MTTQEALAFIHSVSWRGSRPGLRRITELLHRLGDPQNRLRFVHIAGTNGKGSTSAALAAMLTAAGYRTGLYTSPYILRFHERMQVDGVEISDEELTAVTEAVAPHALDMEDAPTEFELVCAIAMAYFARKNCDIVVLEVGMGGRLDATNVIEAPECAIITNIGLDHVRELGDTVEQIAGEKAGILKPGCPVVLYGQQERVTEVIRRRCEENKAALHIADFEAITSLADSREGQRFSYKTHKDLFLPLLGAHQLKNAAVALEAADVLRGRGWAIPESALAEGLAKTLWPARFEIAGRKPWFVVDGGHNPQCAETVADNLLRYFPDMCRVLLVGVLADKDYEGLFDILDPVADAYVTVTPDNPRAMQAEVLAEHLTRYGKPVFACGDMAEAVEIARSLAGAEGVACAVGSLYMAGEALTAIRAVQNCAQIQ